MRSIIGILVGIVTAIVAMLAIAWVGGLLFPVTVSIDASSAQSIARVFPDLPAGAKAAILLSWFGGALAGAYAARRIAGRSWAAWTIAGITAVFVLLNVMVLPMPGWLQAVAIAAPLLGALFGNHLAPDRAPTAPVAEL